MESSANNENYVISVENTFHPLDVTRRTDGNAQTDWERYVHILIYFYALTIKNCYVLV